MDGPTEVFCDNNSAVNNSIIPIPFLNKRHNTIYYHRLREAQDAGVLHAGWRPGLFNPEYFFTNATMPGNTRHNLVELIFSNAASPIGGVEKT